MSYETYRVADLIDEIAMGPFGSNIKVSCFVDSGVPVLNGSNLEGFSLSEKAFRYVTEEKADSLNKANAHRGDIVITHRGTLGQIVFIPQDSRYDRYVISQSQFRVRCNDKVLPEYLVYYFHTPIGQYKLLSNASQVGVPALARPSSTFQQIEVTLPELSIQKRVVEIITTIQRKIENNQELNDNLQQQAQALFKSWFLNYEPWDGTAPNSWLHGKLGDYANIKRGGSPRPIQEYLSDSGLRWLKISDVTGLQTPFIIDIKDHIIEEGLKKTVFLKAGSLVLSNSATPGIPKILDVDSCIHDGWLYFPESRFSNEYLYLYFKYIRQQLVNLSNGSVFNNLKTDILKGYPTILPDEETLQRFDGIIKPMFLQMQNLTRESHDLMDLRDTILPRLMSGELDVSGI
jgi:type I restriction enzyme S subunit